MPVGGMSRASHSGEVVTRTSSAAVRQVGRRGVEQRESARCKQMSAQSHGPDPIMLPSSCCGIVS